MKAVAKDISYSWSAENWLQKQCIQLIENLTGRLELVRMASNYEQEIALGKDFWEVIQHRFGIHLDVMTGAFENLPKEGAVVCVANHPFGICDGLALGRMLSMRREKKDFKIIAHVVFSRAREINKHILPISFDGTKEAIALNLETRRQALEYVQNGGAVAVFPGGCVSTAAKPFGFPIDPRWKTFTAKLVLRTQAQVVPIYFEGHNTRLFQIVSHISQTLRYALLIREFKDRVGGNVGIHIGSPIERGLIESYRKDPIQLMDYHRQCVYQLSPRPMPIHTYGWNGE